MDADLCLPTCRAVPDARGENVLIDFKLSLSDLNTHRSCVEREKPAGGLSEARGPDV